MEARMPEGKRQHGASPCPPGCRQTLAVIATPLEESKTNFRLIIHSDNFTIPDNLADIDPIDFDIIACLFILHKNHLFYLLIAVTLIVTDEGLLVLQLHSSLSANREESV